MVVANNRRSYPVIYENKLPAVEEKKKKKKEGVFLEGLEATEGQRKESLHTYPYRILITPLYHKWLVSEVELGLTTLGLLSNTRGKDWTEEKEGRKRVADTIQFRGIDQKKNAPSSLKSKR
jgi:hypothetical protein